MLIIITVHFLIIIILMSGRLYEYNMQEIIMTQNGGPNSSRSSTLLHDMHCTKVMASSKGDVDFNQKINTGLILEGGHSTDD